MTPSAEPSYQPPRSDLGQLVVPRRQAPPSGARRLLHLLTFGKINLGPSAADQAEQDLIARARRPAGTGRRRIAMVSLKGGVGKTTTTVMLGHTLATVRGDNVIAIDANPDAGNLTGRISRQTTMTVRDLLNNVGALKRYADARAFTSQADSRLEVLAGEADPALSEAFNAADYEATLAALERFYSIILTDCGTGILHDAMRAVLWYSDQLVVVTSPAIDGARALGQLLGWLDQHHCHHLVDSAVAVINGTQRRSGVSIQHLTASLRSQCRAVVEVPYDPALASGGESDLDALRPATRRAYLELAANLGDAFEQPRPDNREPDALTFTSEQPTQPAPPAAPSNEPSTASTVTDALDRLAQVPLADRSQAWR